MNIIYPESIFLSCVFLDQLAFLLENRDRMRRRPWILIISDSKKKKISSFTRKLKWILIMCGCSEREEKWKKVVLMVELILKRVWIVKSSYGLSGTHLGGALCTADPNIPPRCHILYSFLSQHYCSNLTIEKKGMSIHPTKKNKIK